MSKKYSRQEAISSLHPAIRKPVADILDTLHAEGHKFEVFEAWRTPHLQQKYYSKGRNRAGRIVNKSKVVTYAKPWRSFHQYGLAVDLVLKTSRGWSWNDKGANAKKWKRMHEVARDHGMVPLKFEKPHIQIDAVAKSSELYAGKYPVGGDDKWVQKLRDEIMEWSGSPAAPPLPDMPIDRPPIAEVPGGSERGEPSSSPVLTGQQAYPQIIERIFEVEGGYVNHRNDPGGPTNMGITLATLRAWRGKRVTARDVKNLSKGEAADIYERNYFNKVNAGVMPACVAMHVFNTAVLSGPKRGGEMVQKALNALGERVEVDGVIGPQTLSAIFSVDEAALAEEHNKQFLGYLQRLKHWNTFGRGWTNRMNKIHSLAVELAQTPPPPTQEFEKEGRTSGSGNTNAVSVYLFKGLLGDVFSNGLTDLADKLETIGISAHVHHHNDRSKVENEIRSKHQQGQLGELVLIGHSLGANTALRISNALAKDEIAVDYLATLDPTITRSIGEAAKADNFRSRDIRDKPIPGATEYPRDDLSHIQLDNDQKIHEHIISACNALKQADTNTNEENPMSDSDQTRSGAGGVGSSPSDNTPEIDALIAALLGRATSGSSNQFDLSDGIDRSEILEVIRIISGRKSLTPNEDGDDPNNPMTPVNSLFGDGPISRFLNGKKTAIGIFGLLGTYVLPILFPQAAPLVALFNGLGIENVVTENGKEGSQLLTGIFSAFAAWGGLGKLEKWTRRLERVRL